MRFRLFALVIVFVFLLSYSYAGIGTHDTNHSHDIEIATFILKDGVTEMTADDRWYDAILGKLQGDDIWHRHQVRHDGMGEREVKNQDNYDSVLSDLDLKFDTVDDELDAGSALRIQVLAQRSTILFSANAFEIGVNQLVSFKDDIDGAAVSVGSYDAFLQSSISRILQYLIDYEGHEDHMGVRRFSQDHTFFYFGKLGRENNEKKWKVMAKDVPMAPPKPPVSEVRTRKDKRKLTLTWASLKNRNR